MITSQQIVSYYSEKNKKIMALKIIIYFQKKAFERAIKTLKINYNAKHFRKKLINIFRNSISFHIQHQIFIVINNIF
jgi:hypothetical protein